MQSRRLTIATAPPEGLDYALSEGPVPRKPFRGNYLHFNRRWFWHRGDDGVHYVDVCRWALGVDYPVRDTSAGGRYRRDDDRETPDTQVVAFGFGRGKMIAWEGVSCNGFRPRVDSDEMVFTGEAGSPGISGGGYTIHDLDDKAKEDVSSPGGGADHPADFVAAVRGEPKENSAILQGHRSTHLCRRGNIPRRTGRALNRHPKDGRILGGDEALKLWAREYAPGREQKV